VDLAEGEGLRQHADHRPVPELANHMVPLLWQDIFEIYQGRPGRRACAGYGPDLFGVSVSELRRAGAEDRQEHLDAARAEQEGRDAGASEAGRGRREVEVAPRLEAVRRSEADRQAEGHDRRLRPALRDEPRRRQILPVKTQGQAEAIYLRAQAEDLPVARALAVHREPHPEGLRRGRRPSRSSRRRRRAACPPRRGLRCRRRRITSPRARRGRRAAHDAGRAAGAALGDPAGRAASTACRRTRSRGSGRSSPARPTRTRP
jgi:hypothetical protein